MAAEPDPQQLLTALTPEHFTLQGARSQTVSESASRASLYLFSVSSTLVALGFIGQISTVGDTFKGFQAALMVAVVVAIVGALAALALLRRGSSGETAPPSVAAVPEEEAELN
jgi:arginine utilization protein RocB